MLKRNFDHYLRHLDRDIPAGVVVFLVALPLCLGIAVASGAPPFSGVIAGIVGGLVVAVVSGSQLSVSGPSPAPTVIVAGAVATLGYNGLLTAVVISGLIQVAMGYLRVGIIGAVFPSSVIKGMLAAIGIILIMKQFPHAIGYDADADSDLSFLEGDSHTTLSVISDALNSISPGATLVALVSCLILLLWEMRWIKANRFLAIVPSALLAVGAGIAINSLAQAFFPSFVVASQHLVALPKMSGPVDFVREFSLPDFIRFLDPQAYVIGATLALVGSLETLLSLEAVDKLDPLRRVAPTNQELKAQGVGNLVSGLIGGLPITAVIIRSSANINAGAQTKIAAFVHGILLMLSVIFLGAALNMIPLACLAAVLLITGYKLARPALFIEQYQRGVNQFVPFIVTIAAILATDLLKGMGIGLAVGLFFVLRANYHSAFTLTRDGKNYLLRLQKDVSFLNKGPLREHLLKIEEGAYLLIDGSRVAFIDQDILETLEDFIKAASVSNIRIEMKNLRGIAMESDGPRMEAPAQG